MTEYAVEHALSEIGDLVRCRCHPAYKDRKMHDPDCHCDSSEAVSAVAAEIARLTAERDALRTQIKALPGWHKGGPDGGWSHPHGEMVNREEVLALLDNLIPRDETAV